jgi:hypothetical protein
MNRSDLTSSGVTMSALTANHPPVVQDAIDARVDGDERRRPTPIEPGRQFRASNGRLWTVRALHPGERVELVADAPSGPIAMIIDTTAAARMVPIDGRHAVTGPADGPGPRPV